MVKSNQLQPLYCFLTTISFKPAVDMRQSHITDNGHALEQMKLLKNKYGTIIAQPWLLILRHGATIICRES